MFLRWKVKRDGYMFPEVFFGFHTTFFNLFFMHYLSWSVWAATTKYHRLGSLQTTGIYFSEFGSWKSEIRVPAWSRVGPLLGCELFVESSPAGRAKSSLGPLLGGH